MKRLLFTFLVIAIIFSACKKEEETPVDNTATTYAFSCKINGANFSDNNPVVTVAQNVLTIEDEKMIPDHGLGVVFRRKPMPGWHNCPRRQFVLVISGEAELGFGDGSTQRIRPGDICLMEDHTGQGHTTTAIVAPWLSIQIPVSMDAQIAI